MPLFIIEYIAAVIMLLYYMFWVYSRPVTLFGVKISSAGLLNFTLIFIVVCLLYLLIHALFPGLTRPLNKLFDNIRKHTKSGSKNKPVEEPLQPLQPPQSPQPQTPEVIPEATPGIALPELNAQPDAKPKKKNDSRSTVIGIVALVAIPYLGYLSLIKIFETAFPGALPSFNAFKPLLLRLTIAISILLVILVPLSVMKNRILARGIFFAFYSLTFIGLVYLYSTQWYKKIDFRLGGGRPVPINIWIKKADFPEQISMRHASTDLSLADSSYTNWKNSRLLIENDHEIAIIAQDSTWVIIPKDKILLFERVRNKR
jgi:glucan phosphoethanolaminetransferase (alkaline phosphatase superfamily)